MSIDQTQLPEPPERLSDLIELAIEDARKLDRNLYQPNYLRWHLGADREQDAIVPVRPVCMICLAGAVMANTLGAERYADCTPDTFDSKWDRALGDLDEVRMGYFNLLEYYDVPRELSVLLPEPAAASFVGWPSFETHLQSLEPIVAILREHGC